MNNDNILNVIDDASLTSSCVIPVTKQNAVYRLYTTLSPRWSKKLHCKTTHDSSIASVKITIVLFQFVYFVSAPCYVSCQND